jgi:hypothetical protein
MREPDGGRRDLTTALVVALATVVVALAAITPTALRLASTEAPSDEDASAGRAPGPPASNTAPSATTPPVAPPTSAPPPATTPPASTTTTERSAIADRLTDATGVAGCEPLPPEAPVDPAIDPTTYLRPSTPDARGAFSGSRLVLEVGDLPRGSKIQVRRVGEGDIAVATLAPDQQTHAVVVGHLDQPSGTFRRVATFIDCREPKAVAVGGLVVIAGAGASGTHLFAVDLATGGLPWRWFTPRGWAADLLTTLPGTVSMAAGGYRQYPSDWGLATVDASTGAVRSVVTTGAYPPGGVVDADEGLWIARELPNGTGTRFEELDPATLTVIRGVDDPGRMHQRTVIRSGALWRIDDTSLLRRELGDGTTTVIPLESGVGAAPRLAAGPSGIWILSSSGPGLTTTTLTHVDPGSGAARAVARRPTRWVGTNVEGEQEPGRWEVFVDHVGITFGSDGDAAEPCRCLFELTAG